MMETDKSLSCIERLLSISNKKYNTTHREKRYLSMNIFDPDSGLMRTVSKFTDCICLSLLFFICSIPIFTIGTAATALYHTVYRVLRYDRGYVFQDYMSTFRDNFKQTTPVWLIVMAIGSVLGLDFYVLNFYAQKGIFFQILSIIFIVGVVLLFLWISYLFPYMARFQNTRKQSMKNAILMAMVHFPMTILILVLAIIIGVVMYIMPFLMFILPAIYTWIQSFILEWIFRKYMSEEDRIAEDERNRRE